MATTPHSQSTQSAPEQAGPQQTPRTGIALTLIAATQLMLVLDGTIMNIALPSVQTALDIPAGRLSWVVNAYALTFGGLLLLGGRIGDLWGRRRVFRFSLALFAAASLAGGLATQETVLIAARACQGVAAAIAAPTALSLIATTFAEGPSRNRAMGVYGAMSGLGSIIGLLLGGLLTEFLNWRWVLFVNIPICLAVLAGTGVLVEGSRVRGRLDLPGALTGSLGLLVLVYAIVRGGDAGWSDPVTLGAGLAALLLLSCFLVIQSRSPHPMMPLGLLRDRNRGAAYATMLLVGGGMFATYYFLTLFMQQVQGWDAMTTGLAYLPFATGMGVASGILGPRLLGRFSPRTVIVPGLAAATLGMVVFSQISPGSSYLLHLMPAMVLTSVGLGLSVRPPHLGGVERRRARPVGYRLRYPQRRHAGRRGPRPSSAEHRGPDRNALAPPRRHCSSPAGATAGRDRSGRAGIRGTHPRLRLGFPRRCRPLRPCPAPRRVPDDHTRPRRPTGQKGLTWEKTCGASLQGPARTRTGI